MSQVQRQLNDYESWTGRKWRMGQIVLGTASEVASRRTAKGVYRSEDDLMLSLSMDDSYDETRRVVTGAERVLLVADVTLRSIPADALSISGAP
jgi:hypothetical protein